MANEELWVFGYGSLVSVLLLTSNVKIILDVSSQVWKNNDFEYELKKPGYLKGFVRRFYQNSIDHRGVPEKPGRVVTLVYAKDQEARVYGVGYKIAADKVSEVLSHLDYREKNGYDRHETIFHPLDSSQPKSTIVYVANEQNPSWNSNHDLENIANQISESVGPSGRNTDYVYNLCDAIRQTFPDVHDDHLFDLEKLLRELEAEKNHHRTVRRRLSQEG